MAAELGALTSLMTVVLSLAMLVVAVVAIRARSLPVNILAAGLVSLLAAVQFLILAAPDVAMTEAAIGSGLTTFLFFYVLSRVRKAAPAEADDHG